MTLLAISVDKMAILFDSVIRTRTTAALIVVFVDISPEIASIVAEDVEEAVEISIEEAEVEDELNLKEGEVMMHRKRRNSPRSFRGNILVRRTSGFKWVARRFGSQSTSWLTRL